MTLVILKLPEIFQQYKTKSGRFVRHNEQLHQLFTDRFMGFDKDRGLFRSIANPLEASYEDDEPTSQQELIDPHSSDELGSKFKELYLLNLYTFLKTNIRICVRMQLCVCVCASLIGSATFVNRRSY